MRKLTQPACFVLGILSVGWIGWTVAGKETEAGKLDPKLEWRVSKGSDCFVAVAKSGRSGVGAISMNGSDWAVERLIVGFNALAHGDGKFVAVGEQGALGVTTNGMKWQISSITTNDLWSVGFNGGCFFAIGMPPVREIFTSRNCMVWRKHEIDGEGRLAKFLETWVTVTNRAVELAGSAGDELSALCRASNFERRHKNTQR